MHLSGVTPALSKNLYDISIELVKAAKKKGIVVSYDSNYRAKLWSLSEAKSFMMEILPLIDVAFLGVLDFKNILEYKIDEDDSHDVKLTKLYKELFEKYPNIKYAASTKRTINSVNNNSLKGFMFDGEKLYSSKQHTFDILDRVGGGDAFTAGILKNMDGSEACEFATCASALKHSIEGDINIIDIEQVNILMNCGIESINR